MNMEYPYREGQAAVRKNERFTSPCALEMRVSVRWKKKPHTSTDSTSVLLVK